MLHVIVACLVLVTAAADTAVEFTLEDQRGAEISSQQLRGKPYVLIIADRDGAEHSVRWGEGLYRALGNDAVILGCAALEGVPWFLRWFVRSRFRESVTAVPVLLDWEGVLFRAYRCSPKLPTLIAVDANARVVCRHSGKPDSDAVRNVVALLRQRFGVEQQ
ncbi:MAG: hypothetical protein N2663_01735 [Chlorobi bacterium]|nr:hypothetical protein [Chlorobiota bacterium]